MRRLIKPEGVGNIQVEEVPVPEIVPRGVLVRVERSLISRGSEIGARYLKQEAVDPGIMGYAAAGRVEQVGEAVRELAVGDPVAALRPHADYAVIDLDAPRHRPSVVRLPDRVSLEAGCFWPFFTSGVSWATTARIPVGGTVVVVGQGLVGGMMQQAVRRQQPGQVIAIDALPLRCELAKRLGADVVLNASEVDTVAEVKRLTGGRGGDVVIEAVGGRWAPQVFPQILAMTAVGGRVLLIGLYSGEPLPLDTGLAMTRTIVGANSGGTDRVTGSDVALRLLATGAVQTEPLITHRFPADEAKAAYDLLYERPGEALGVILEWV